MRKKNLGLQILVTLLLAAVLRIIEDPNHLVASTIAGTVGAITWWRKIRPRAGLRQAVMMRTCEQYFEAQKPIVSCMRYRIVQYLVVSMYTLHAAIPSA